MFRTLVLDEAWSDDLILLDSEWIERELIGCNIDEPLNVPNDALTIS